MENPILSVDVDWIRGDYQHPILIDYVSKKFKTCENIVFIDNHDAIIKYFSNNDKSIINIDHHHDITNPVGSPLLSTISEGNWVSYLIARKGLKDYIWINNVDSIIMGETIERGRMRNLNIFKMYINFDEIKDFKYKKIIICKSIDWHWESGYAKAVLAYDILKIIANNFFSEKVIIDNEPNPYKLKQI